MCSCLSAAEPSPAQGVPPPDCPWELSQLGAWRELLIRAKRTNRYTSEEINRALGVVLAARNLRSDPCYFDRELQGVQLLIFKIIADEPSSSL